MNKDLPEMREGVTRTVGESPSGEENTQCKGPEAEEA